MQFLLILVTMLFTTQTLAATLSTCDSNCFKAKQACNGKKSHTFNSCHDDLFICRASCQTGKIQETYRRTTLPIDVAFHPILDFEK